MAHINPQHIHCPNGAHHFLGNLLYKRVLGLMVSTEDMLALRPSFQGSLPTRTKRNNDSQEMPVEESWATRSLEGINGLASNLHASRLSLGPQGVCAAQKTATNNGPALACHVPVDVAGLVLLLLCNLECELRSTLVQCWMHIDRLTLGDVFVVCVMRHPWYPSHAPKKPPMQRQLLVPKLEQHRRYRCDQGISINEEQLQQTSYECSAPVHLGSVEEKGAFSVCLARASEGPGSQGPRRREGTHVEVNNSRLRGSVVKSCPNGCATSLGGTSSWFQCSRREGNRSCALLVTWMATSSWVG